jgi:hypothetical protein
MKAVELQWLLEKVELLETKQGTDDDGSTASRR